MVMSDKVKPVVCEHRSEVGVDYDVAYFHLLHGSKLRSWPPTRRAPFHIDIGVAVPTRARCTKRYLEGSKNAEKNHNKTLKNVDIKIDV